MPSGMLPILDGPITRGMNTVDDPKVLKQGECVKLLNAFPGVPPVPRNGCTGRLLVGTQNYRYIPPGISFEYGGVVYAVVWVYDTVGEIYTPIAIKISDGTFTELGDADFGSSTVLFGLIEAYSCIYANISQFITAWESDTKALGHKVIESNSVIRDMCISVAAFATAITGSGNGGILSPSDPAGNGYVEFAFNYVRRNDTAAFEAGGPISGLILPPNITADYKPKRMDTYLPGSCIGIEDAVNYREVKSVKTAITPDAGMLSESGLGTFTAANCVDNNLANTGFEVDSATAGAYLAIDYGSGQTRNMIQFGLHMELAGSTANFKVQYSDNGSAWTDAATDFIPALIEWNYVSITATTGHRYWRLYLTNAPGAGPNVHEIICYGKTIFTFDISQSHATALAQGATHLRVSRSLIQTTSALAQGATKFWLTDLPICAVTSYDDTVTDAALQGEENQLITGYTSAPAAAFIEHSKGRIFLMDLTGKVYYSESPGGDGGTSEEMAQTYPQAWGSLFKPFSYFLDCDYVDGQVSTGMKLLGDDLFFFKERKIFGLFGGDPLSTTVSKVSENVGCAFPYTITKCDIKGMFGKCLLFLGNDGPMVMLEGGRIRPFSEFKIKELWPEKSTELYSELDNDYDWIVHNCTAAFYKNTWWILYQTKAGTNKIFGYYFDPDIGSDSNAPRGALKFEFADM